MYSGHQSSRSRRRNRPNSEPDVMEQPLRNDQKPLPLRTYAHIDNASITELYAHIHAEVTTYAASLQGSSKDAGKRIECAPGVTFLLVYDTTYEPTKMLFLGQRAFATGQSIILVKLTPSAVAQATLCLLQRLLSEYLYERMVPLAVDLITELPKSGIIKAMKEGSYFVRFNFCKDWDVDFGVVYEGVSDKRLMTSRSAKIKPSDIRTLKKLWEQAFRPQFHRVLSGVRTENHLMVVFQTLVKSGYIRKVFKAPPTDDMKGRDFYVIDDVGNKLIVQAKTSATPLYEIRKNPVCGSMMLWIEINPSAIVDTACYRIKKLFAGQYDQFTKA